MTTIPTYLRLQLLWSVASLLVLQYSASASDSSLKVAKYSRMSLSGNLSDSTPFELEIDKSGSAAELDRTRGTIDKHLQSLTLLLGKERISIPESVYTELQNIQLPGPYLLQDGDSVLVVCNGGDGGEAYSCVIVVRGKRVVRREIFKPPFKYYGDRPPTSTDVY